MKKFIFTSLVISVALFSSCSKYGYVQLKYPTPPPVYLPEGIHTLAIVNRSLVKKEDKQNSVIDAIINGKIAGSDKLASDECLKGVFDRINGYRDINIVIPSQTRLYGTGTRQTPEILDWNLVKQICDSTKADALLVLESFNSSSDVILATVTNQINNVLNGNPVNVAPPSQIRMNVISFWRLYDPIYKKIIDQYQTSSYLTFDAGSSSIPVPPPDALSKTAYAAGQEYIERFLPGYYFVKRDMYKRGKGSSKQKFLAAFRHSEVADWNGAIPIWEELAKNSRRKNAGRACVDLAVAYEVLGKTDTALMWAKKAYEDYGNKVGRDYANKLKYRVNIENGK